MTEELSGIYFGETVSTIASDTDEEEELCFLVQTSTAIASLDNTLTYYTSIDTFKTDTTGKGLTDTVAFIETVLSLANKTNFYVYSIKTNTAAGFQEAVNCSADIKEIRKVIYYEENTIDNDLALASKMSALATACHNCYKYGAFRIAFVVPANTIAEAVEDAENVAPETTVVTTFTSLLTGDGDGRLAVILPDKEANIMATIVASPFDQDAGKGNILGTPGALTYNFSRTQMKTLLNLGVIFIRTKRERGQLYYRIEGGITTSFKSGKADGTISARQTADELLHQVDIGLTNLINDKEHANNLSDAQTVCDDVIADFVENMYVTQDGTNLTVADTGNMKFSVSGQITTIKPLRTIDVNTVIA